MTVTILTNDRKWQTMLFDPMHEEGIRSFYTDLVEQGQILGYNVYVH